MKERQILFSAPMVKAILEGRKTQTRRALKHQPCDVKRVFMRNYGMSYVENLHGVEIPHWQCPYGQPGDRLWVRETWQHSNFPFGPLEECCDIFYRADYFDDPLGPDLEKSEDGIRRKWKSPIHMPRWASRITLEITNVRVERLQDISEADAIAEGGKWTDNGPRHWAKPGATFDELNPVNGWNEGWSHIGQTDQDKCLSSARMSYANLWESINGTGSWDANPFVWCISFKVV